MISHTLRRSATEAVGPYRIEAPLGGGGGGAVYRARDPRLRRVVALKVAHAATPVDRARLWREARTLAQIEHPNLVRVYDVGEDAETRKVYVAMELLGGPRLMELLDEPWPPALAARAAVELCGALGALHDAGFVHRDVKPSNVVFDDDGALRLVDLGLAKSTAPEDAITETGAVVGTLGYMSPEQLRGEPCAPASDVFSVCVVLYCLLAGTHPFARESRSGTAQANALAAYPEITDRRPDVPAALAAALARGLDADPDRRFASATDLAAALEAAGPVAPPEALARLARDAPSAPDDAPPAPPTPSRRALLGAVGLAALLAGGLWASRPAPLELPPQPAVMVTEITLSDDARRDATRARLEYALDRARSAQLVPRVPGRSVYALRVEEAEDGLTLTLLDPRGRAIDRASAPDAEGARLAEATRRWFADVQAPPAASDEVWSIYERARGQHRRGRYQFALERFRAALALSPGFAPAYVEAVELSDTPLGPAPGGLSPLEAARVASAALVHAGEGVEALKILYRARERWPQDLALARRVMDLRFWNAARDFDAVLDAAKDVLRIDPMQAQAASRLLRALAWRGRIDEAQRILAELGALEHAPPTLRAEIALYEGRYGDALTAFEVALDEGPNDYAAHMAVVAELLDGEAGAATARAETLLREARLRGEGDDWAHHLGIEARIADGRLEAADKALSGWCAVSASCREQRRVVRFELDRLRYGEAAVRDDLRREWATGDPALRVEIYPQLARVETAPARLRAYDDWLTASPDATLDDTLVRARKILRARVRVLDGDTEAGLSALEQSILPLAQVQTERDLKRRIDGLVTYALALDRAGRASDAEPVWRTIHDAGYGRMWSSAAWLRADRRLPPDASAR